MRAFAIVSIVFCHCTESIYPLNQQGWDAAGTVSQIIRTIYFTFGRLGVPLFLFLSGYLLFSRYVCKNWNDITSFIKTKWLPLFICYEVWVLIYSAFVFFSWDRFELKTLLMEMLIVRQPPFSHLWYMPMIIGLYLAIPFLSFLFYHFGTKFLYILFALSLVKSTFGRHFLIDFQYLGSCYITYLIFGYVVFTLKDKLLNRKIVLYAATTLFTLLFLYLVYRQVVRYESGHGFNVWYTYPALILGSMALFPIGYIFNRFNFGFIQNLSLAAFAIYLMHNLFLVTVIKYFNSIELIPKSILTCLLCLFCVASSFAVFKLITMMRISRLNKLLFLAK